jgi:hypothetical protein
VASGEEREGFPLFCVSVAFKGLRYCATCLESTVAGSSGGVAVKGVSFDGVGWVRERVFLDTKIAEEEFGRDGAAGPSCLRVNGKLASLGGRVIENRITELNYCQGIVL